MSALDNFAICFKPGHAIAWPEMFTTRSGAENKMAALSSTDHSFALRCHIVEADDDIVTDCLTRLNAAAPAEIRWMKIEDLQEDRDEGERVLLALQEEVEGCDGEPHWLKTVATGTIYATDLQTIATTDDQDEYADDQILGWSQMPPPPGDTRMLSCWKGPNEVLNAAQEVVATNSTPMSLKRLREALESEENK